jgi:hypothetical protein
MPPHTIGCSIPSSSVATVLNGIMIGGGRGGSKPVWRGSQPAAASLRRPIRGLAGGAGLWRVGGGTAFGRGGGTSSQQQAGAQPGRLSRQDPANHAASLNEATCSRSRPYSRQQALRRTAGTTSASSTPVRGTPGRHGRRPALPPGPRRLRAMSQHGMGGKPVVEMAKQNDAEMDKSGYVPPHRNCTPSGSQDSLGANALGKLVARAVTVPIPHDAEDELHFDDFLFVFPTHQPLTFLHTRGD